LSCGTSKIGFSTHPDSPAAVADGAGCQAGGVSRRSVERPFRFGIGIGWNLRRLERKRPQPRQALGEAGRTHAQVVDRAACHLKEQWHTIEDAGINPLQTHCKISLWCGGGHEGCNSASDRQKGGDGWIIIVHPSGASVRRHRQRGFRQAVQLRETCRSRSEGNRVSRSVALHPRRRPR